MGTSQETFSRILFEKVIETFSTTVKKEILLDEKMQERWGFGIVTMVTLGSDGPTFERHALFAALRSAIEQLSVSIDVADDQGINWKVMVDKNGQGDLEFWISKNQVTYRLEDYSHLAKDKKIRLAWLENLSRKIIIPEEWVKKRRDELVEAPLSDEAFAEIDRDIRSMPSSLDKEIRNDLQRYRANFQLIAPDQRNYYLRLVGQFESQTSLTEFIDEVSGPMVVSLVENHGALGLRWALLTCGHPRITSKIPLEMLCSKEALEVFEWLAEKGDPVSRLAGIELWMPNAFRLPDLEKPATHIVKALLDSDDNTTNHYTALSAVFSASMGVMARQRLFCDAPPSYRRQAALTHASLCTQAVIEEGLKPFAIEEWLKGTGSPQIAFCQGLIDLRTEPCWLPEYSSPSQLRAEMIGRLSLAVQTHGDALKSSDLKKLLVNSDSMLAEVMERTPFFLPGPLEGATIEANPLSENVLEEARLLFSGAEISPDTLLKVVNSAYISGNTTEIAALASKALKRVKYLIDTKGSETTTFQVLVALAMTGSISRNCELARCLRVLTRVKRSHDYFRQYPENDIRIASIAASAFYDFEEWACFLGDWILEITQSFDPQKDPTNLLALIRQLRKLEPGLAPHLSKPEATLLFSGTVSQ